MADDKTFLGTGWSFPPSFANSGHEVHTVSGPEDIEQSLTILLSTQRNERAMQKNFGCNLDEFLFAQLSRELVSRIRSAVEDAIQRYEPRIALNRVEVTGSRSDAGTLLIGIDYTILATNSRFNMVYPFYINGTTSAVNE